jgi:hypothetical protein
VEKTSLSSSKYKIVLEEEEEEEEDAKELNPMMPDDEY